MADSIDQMILYFQFHIGKLTGIAHYFATVNADIEIPGFGTRSGRQIADDLMAQIQGLSGIIEQLQ